MSASPSRCRPWPTARPTARRIARTSPIAVPSPASMRASRRRRRRSSNPGCSGTLLAKPHLLPMPAELRADLDVLDRSLRDNGSAILARGRLRSLRRAVDVFGFHLASLDLRQNSDVHERTIGELLEAACPGTGYAGLAEPARIARLLEELGTARPLASPSWPIRRRRLGAGDFSSRGRDPHGCTVRPRWPTA